LSAWTSSQVTPSIALPPASAWANWISSGYMEAT
jgi:hypothetical protein